ncbi:TadE/TadG family type IV pilus assembly protein [Paenibacillus tarimensis]
MKQIRFSSSKWICRCRIWVRGEEGSFTLESSLVFPMIFILTLAMLLMSLYVYQKVILYHISSAAADRTAFNWGNSHRSADTGQAPDGSYDGLYWRVSDDDMLESFFGVGKSEERAVIRMPNAGTRDEGRSLPERKLSAASAWIPVSYAGEIAYEQGALVRKISVKLRHAISLSPLEALIGRSEPNSRAQSAVVDPPEFIRNVELVRYYSGKFGGSDGASSRREAAEILRNKRAGDSGRTGGRM